MTLATALLVFLHISVMFSAVAISQGPAFMLYRAMQKHDVAGIRAIGGQFATIGPKIGMVFGVGVVIGLITVFVGGWNPLSPWLLIAYVLTVVAILTPRLVTAPRMMRVGMAAAQSPLDAPSPELRSEIAAATQPIYWLDAAILVLFVVDMVVKPFS
jgi:hypothetical protein